MRALRSLVGLITLAYAAWTIFEAAVGVLGFMGPLPPKLVATLGPLLPTVGPWWVTLLTLAGGLAYGVAATRIMSEPRGAWRVFLFAAVLDLAARWGASLLAAPGDLQALVLRDKLVLAVLAIGLVAYAGLSRARKKRIAPAVLTA